MSEESLDRHHWAKARHSTVDEGNGLRVRLLHHMSHRQTRTVEKRTIRLPISHNYRSFGGPGVREGPNSVQFSRQVRGRLRLAEIKLFDYRVS